MLRCAFPCGFEVSAVCVRVRFFGDLLCNRRVNGVGLENLGDACGAESPRAFLHRGRLPLSLFLVLFKDAGVTSPSKAGHFAGCWPILADVYRSGEVLPWRSVCGRESCEHSARPFSQTSQDNRTPQSLAPCQASAGYGPRTAGIPCVVVCCGVCDFWF